jgi:hypothetical protein
LKADARIWDAPVFTKNRQRLLDGDIARAFFERVEAQARLKMIGLLGKTRHPRSGRIRWKLISGPRPSAACRSSPCAIMCRNT